MRNFIITSLFLFFSVFSFSQTPGIKWTKYYPNDTYDQAFFDIKAINGGGFLLAGGDYSGFYDKNRFLSRISSGRASLIKIDQDGNVIWNRSTGDSASYTSIQIESDGSIIAAGYSMNFPEFSIKYFIAKYDNNGNELWRRSYGNATGISRANSIMKTSDNGYILAGNTNANDGDVSGNHGSTDVWLLKLDDSGYVQWKKCFGGTGADSAYAVAETPDNGFVVAGSSTSSNGNLTGNNGLSDAWIFKVDNAGNLVWQKNIGGTGHENFKSLVVNSDSSFTLTGYTFSTTVTSGGNHGKRDLWVIKLSKTAAIQWSKAFGGSQDDQGCSIQRTIGNGYLVGGYTESSNGDITSNNGGADTWLLYLTFDGNLIWQKTIGTNKDELGMAAAYLSETDFAIGGFAQPTIPAAPWDHVDAILSVLGNTNIIKGILYYDLNSNSIKDPGEENFTLANVKTVNGSFERVSIPTDQGFLMYVDLGTFTTSVVLQSAYYTVAPSSYSSNFTTYFNTDSFSFAVQPIPGLKDLVINAFPLNVARPGFNVSYKILYKNVGTAIANTGEILFKKDSRLNFVSAVPAISSSNGDTLKWSYSNLQPLDSSSITVQFVVKVPPQVSIGDTLTSMGIITPVAGDQTPLDDTVVVKQIVIGSFDPNDKYEKNEGRVPPAYVADGRYLDYLVRFQNLGTDTAFNIVVLDTLSEKLDLSSLQVIATSHSYKVTLTDNILRWTFDDILLPHSAINEPASHGYIAYRIKPFYSVALGDTIHNTASIYFDFNLPVQTNNAFTVVQDDVALGLDLLSFAGVYREEKTTLQWTTANEVNIERFEIQRSFTGTDFGTIGQVMPRGRIGTVAQYEFIDLLNNISANTFFYRLLIREKDGKISYSKILLFKRDTKASNSISINPNPVTGISVVNVNYSSQTSAELRVLDMNGKVVLKQRNTILQGNNSINIAGMEKLGPGFYLLQAITKDHKLTAPFVIK